VSRISIAFRELAIAGSSAYYGFADLAQSMRHLPRIRSSKGWRRHVRREKQARRRG
jgi:hypothetical protein